MSAAGSSSSRATSPYSGGERSATPTLSRLAKQEQELQARNDEIARRETELRAVRDEASWLEAELQKVQAVNSQHRRELVEVQAAKAQHQRELAGLIQMRRRLALAVYQHVVDPSELNQEQLSDDDDDGDRDLGLPPPQPPAEDQ